MTNVRDPKQAKVLKKTRKSKKGLVDVADIENGRNITVVTVYMVIKATLEEADKKKRHSNSNDSIAWMYGGCRQ